MRDYLGIVGKDGIMHIFERSLTAYGNGDIGLCVDAERLMVTQAGDRPFADYVPTCLACIAKETRVRSRD